MAKTFHLTVARVGQNLFDGEALSVTLPGSAGVLTVLAGHEPLVTPLENGTLTITDADGTKMDVAIENGGVLEVSDNQATVLL